MPDVVTLSACKKDATARPWARRAFGPPARRSMTRRAVSERLRRPTISPADLTAYRMCTATAAVHHQVENYAYCGSCSNTRSCRFVEEYRPLRNTKPPAGQAVGDDAQAHLFATAKSRLTSLEVFALCGHSHPVEAHLVGTAKLAIRRSKTPAGSRDPSMNDTRIEALRQLHAMGQRSGSQNRSTTRSHDTAEQGAGREPDR